MGKVLQKYNGGRAMLTAPDTTKYDNMASGPDTNPWLRVKLTLQTDFQFIMTRDV
jgi:hypothetical protein